MTVTERRKHSRGKSFLQGRVYYNGRRSSADCIVRDITETGARLKFADSPMVPEVFELHVPNKQESFRAHVIWNHGSEIGVMFEAPGTPDGEFVAGLVERVARLERELATLKRRIDSHPAVD
ncbi:MAG: PilZ domain-containing protein [Pseudorhodoplanes sp.]